jgi:hypothetical protein
MISGMVAGLAGTLVIQSLQAAGQKSVPDLMPPVKQHPGEYMVERAEELMPQELREKIPQVFEKGAAQMLGIGYGLTFGALFGLLHRKKFTVLLDGSVLGIATWATGYLGWLPATGLMPPITKQKPVQVVGGILSHLLYGMTTAGTLRFLNQRHN